MLVVDCNTILGNIGGYRERPELLEEEAVRLLKSFAAGYLSPTQNLLELFVFKLRLSIILIIK
jgi:hypothetical protein